MGYGTGAIMAVPGQDERDWEFAEVFDLPIIRTVQPSADFDGKAYLGDGPAINSGFLDGLDVDAAKRAIIEWLEAEGKGTGTVTYKLRDWLFSRQRYWGEPFPIVYGDDDLPQAVPEDELPVLLPDLMDWAPRVLDEDSEPEPPLGRVEEWREVELDLGDGPRTYRRELNTMPQWAGSCWYYLRYLDPSNENAMVDLDVERYWMADPDDGGVGGVDLYVGGVEHAVLHLLYARFWHKVLYDLGHVSGPEPFKRLINQGYIQAAAYQDARGIYVPADEVEGDPQAGFTHHGEPVTRSFGKMGKSLKNSVTPDDMYEAFGADTLRLYEMSMGPIDQDRPWETRSVVGSHRLLQRVWRNLVDEDTGEATVVDEAADDELRRLLHATIDGVAADMDALRFNTAIAKLTELNNELTKREAPTPREVADPLVRMLSPLVPHAAEELWAKLGGEGSVTWAEFPTADASLLVADTVEIPVQINGKVRGRVTVAADADEATVLAAARADENVSAHLDGREPKKVIFVAGPDAQPGGVRVLSADDIDAVVFDMGGVFTIQNPAMLTATLAAAGLDVELDDALARRGHYHAIRAETLARRDQPERDGGWWQVFDRAYFSAVGLEGTELDAAVEARTAERSGDGDDVTALWSHALSDNIDGFRRIADQLPVAIVTNNVGTAVEQCARIELCQEGPGPFTEVAAIVDSAIVGISKPDPGIFTFAMDALGTDRARTVYVGDTVHADVRGASAAGLVPLQLDPFDLNADHDHWRLPGVSDLADHLS